MNYKSKYSRISVVYAWASAEGGRGGGQLPPPWIFGQGVSRRELFLNSCQLQSLQLPAALKKGYFIALVVRNFQIFSRSRANHTKISFCCRRAQKMFDIFTFHSLHMHPCMLKIKKKNYYVLIYVFKILVLAMEKALWSPILRIVL